MSHSELTTDPEVYKGYNAEKLCWMHWSALWNSIPIRPIDTKNPYLEHKLCHLYTLFDLLPMQKDTQGALRRFTDEMEQVTNDSRVIPRGDFEWRLDESMGTTFVIAGF